VRNLVSKPSFKPLLSNATCTATPRAAATSIKAGLHNLTHSLKRLVSTSDFLSIMKWLPGFKVCSFKSNLYQRLHRGHQQHQARGQQQQQQHNRYQLVLGAAPLPAPSPLAPAQPPRSSNLNGIIVNNNNNNYNNSNSNNNNNNNNSSIGGAVQVELSLPIA
jgi:hypothetical protein